MSELSLLPANTRIGTVILRTANDAQLMEFYIKVIGLENLGYGALGWGLGFKSESGETCLLDVCEDQSARRPTQAAPGLFHFALLLPTRADLGQFLIHLMKFGYRLDGASDHIVSEALYLADPDDNGIEVYWDRPRSEWKFAPNGEVKMSSDPLDIESLIRDGESLGKEWHGMPAGTTIGHMHLQVSNLEKSVAFYRDIIGLGIKQSSYPGARFLAAGDYHHHLGINTWRTANAAPAQENSAGLMEWELLVTDKEAYDALVARLKSANALEIDEDLTYAVDPDGIKMSFDIG